MSLPTQSVAPPEPLKWHQLRRVSYGNFDVRAEKALLVALEAKNVVYLVMRKSICSMVLFGAAQSLLTGMFLQLSRVKRAADPIGSEAKPQEHGKV